MERQGEDPLRASAAMPGAVSGGDTGRDEDWVVLSPHEAPTAPDDCLPSNPSRNAYIDFQLRTRFGTFSFVARPVRKDIELAEVETDQTIHPQEQSLLFNLPVEIRLEIYEHLLQIPASGSAANIVQRPARRDRTPNSLTVLLTCRRALAEAEGIFYSINRLSLEQPTKFLASLGSRRRSAITKFALPVGSAGSMLSGLEQLHTLPNLCSLHIQRKASVKYQDVSSWAIMAPQLVVEIEKMETLTEVIILTPEAIALTEQDVARKHRLDGIDLRLCNAASNGILHAGAVR